MTTTVTIEAHCSHDTEVLIQAVENGNNVASEVYIKDGAKFVIYAHGNREIRVSEVPAK